MNDGDGSLRRLLRKHASGSIDELPLWALSEGASCLMVDVAAYESCRVVGIVQRLRIDPVNRVVEISLTDGTALISASWTVHGPAPQLALVPGRAAILSGVTGVGPEGDVVLIEPTFSLIQVGTAA